MYKRNKYKFENLEVWEVSLELADQVYEIVKLLPQSEEFNLKSQLRRAVTSISLNIAEGSTAATNAEQIRFLKISLRSLIEVIACLRLIEKRNYTLDNKHRSNIEFIANKLFAKLNAFITSLS
jgi:four helix bundle protein